MRDRNFSDLLYCYISTQAACDPCRTIYLCPPGPEAATLKAAEEFAIRSGWQALAEENGSVLIVPVVCGSWSDMPKSLFMEIYKKTANGFETRSGQAIWGRQGKLWCWETMLYLAGYGDGAVFAGNVLVEYPNMFAAAALIDGVPDDYTGGEALSCHWLVPNVSDGYRRKNREIPVHVWMFQNHSSVLGGSVLPKTEAARDYFVQSYGETVMSEVHTGLWHGYMTASQAAPACQTRVLGRDQDAAFPTDFEAEGGELSRTIFTQCFEHVIRWKNSPDGTLALTDSREEFYASPRFGHRRTAVDGREYDYFVHLPKGKTGQQVKGLPLVFTVHGRGEPAWLFTSKNGWDRLADETGEFVLVSPDSPGNIWFLPRDGKIFPQIVKDMVEEFGIDESRVYLTGFSNGGMIVREVAVSYPELFAGVSPWNAPVGNTAAMMKADSGIMVPEFDKEFTAALDKFLKSGYGMPCAFIFGDKDRAAVMEKDLMIKPMLEANDCVSGIQEEKEGYSITCHKNSQGKTMVTVTVMKDMPHGAIQEESRLTWQFLREFRRTPLS